MFSSYRLIRGLILIKFAVKCSEWICYVVSRLVWADLVACPFTFMLRFSFFALLCVFPN